MSLTDQERTDRRRGYERKYSQNPANRGKRYARTAVFRALESGELVHPLSCENCGETAKVEAHHEDYCKPLDVRWLCVNCHRTIHYKTHCKNGHELTPDNVYVGSSSATRACRTCRTNSVRKHRKIAGPDSAAVRAAKIVAGQD